MKDSINVARKLLREKLGVSASGTIEIFPHKKGMTNTSYIGCLHDKRFIIRFPGEGTSALISRYNEEKIYKKLQIEDLGLCDHVVYFDPDTGIKISEYIEDSRTCSPHDIKDIRRCFKSLRKFHEKKIIVDFDFDIFERINFYESLRQKESMYEEYSDTKERIFSLCDFINHNKSEYVLSHIDSVSDNFLLTKDRVFLIDWEYAGMQDPHMDIAMFCVYNKYTEEEIDRIIDAYFEDEKCSEIIRTKIYAYISACGFLWSNWCEYKMQLGIRFGEYARMQYNYAKRYYEKAREII